MELDEKKIGTRILKFADAQQDVYIDYPYENVVFRRSYSDGRIFQKFYGEQEFETKNGMTNGLYCEAVLDGNLINRQTYLSR